jgi:hypothetical protein
MEHPRSIWSSVWRLGVGQNENKDNRMCVYLWIYFLHFGGIVLSGFDSFHMDSSAEDNIPTR